MVKTLKEKAQKFLARVPDEYVFWCCDGRLLRGMKELGDALNAMSDETFACHSNTEKNDFAVWVRAIIGDEKLAKDLGKTKTQDQAAKYVISRVSMLSKRLT